MTSDYDVAIVGAGSSGVAAARRLAGSGLTVALLEAASRVGGRAWTVELNGMPLDLGCGWLHSADRNAWVRVAEARGIALDRRPSAWSVQYRDLGFPPEDQDAADRAFDAWSRVLRTAPPPNDRAGDVIAPDSEWRAYVEAISGFLNGAGLDRISVADYLAYDEAATRHNWRAPMGYGALIAGSLPAAVDLRLATPVDSVRLDRGVTLCTASGDLHAKAAILAVSTSVLARGGVALPTELEPWRRAAEVLPLGRNEKLFFAIVEGSPFETETHVLGNPRDARTGSYYIAPFGRPVIECFLGGAGAEILANEGAPAGFAHAFGELVALFGGGARKSLRPLAASDWSRSTRIGGAYSHALPGHASARAVLAQPFDGRIFFAGEATHPFDFSTAHGAYESGVRAAEEAIAALAARRV